MTANQEFRSRMLKLAGECADGADRARVTFRAFTWLFRGFALIAAAAGVFGLVYGQWFAVLGIIASAVMFWQARCSARDGTEIVGGYLTLRQDILTDLARLEEPR